MDFFEIVKKMQAKTYTECVAAMQGIKMSYKDVTPMIGEETITVIPPAAKNKVAIVMTGKNMRSAALKAYPTLNEDQQKFVKNMLEDFMKKGLCMPILGKMDKCNAEEKERIKAVIG